MAPLGTALEVRYDGQNNDTDVFSGSVDGDWTVKTVPNGGYVLGLVVQSCVERQASTSHPDPIHVTSHFLQPTSVAPFEVHVRVLRIGRQFTNVLASLLQGGKTRITTHIIFGSLSPTNGRLNLSPTSPYARRHPLHIHPSQAVETRMIQRWGFQPHVRWARDPVLRSQNLPDSPTRTNSQTAGGGGLVWGAWFQLADPEARITPAAIAFLADTFLNLPSLLPRAERQGVVSTDTWFPTVTMSIEYKAAMPPPSATHAARTVGIFASGTFWGEPSGRHDCYVEVWTAPVELGDGQPASQNWRDTQLCLATSTQMALCLPAKSEAKL
ncbi:thioesterase-like superfamily-domain-containing protein [Mycena amicta]|nr:thioesterase-like superfamily-domain-containing protein [Mycena amicta]